MVQSEIMDDSDYDPISSIFISVCVNFLFYGSRLTILWGVKVYGSRLTILWTIYRPEYGQTGTINFYGAEYEQPVFV